MKASDYAKGPDGKRFVIHGELISSYDNKFHLDCGACEYDKSRMIAKALETQARLEDISETYENWGKPHDVATDT